MTWRALIPLACLALGLAGPVAAQTQYQDEILQAEVLPGWRAEAGMHIAGLRLRLAPGWKTYWRAPGEGGIPPEFYFGASENLGALQTLFPAPTVFYASGLRSIGYMDEVILPLRIGVVQAGQDVRFRARLDLGVCDQICMPMSVDFDVVLPPSGARDGAILAAIDAVPPRVETPLACAFEPISDGMRMAVRFDTPRGAGPQAVAVLEPGVPGIWASDTTVSQAGGRMTATVDFVPPRGQPLTLDRSAIRLTVIGGRSVEMIGCD